MPSCCAAKYSRTYSPRAWIPIHYVCGRGVAYTGNTWEDIIISGINVRVFHIKRTIKWRPEAGRQFRSNRRFLWQTGGLLQWTMGDSVSGQLWPKWCRSGLSSTRVLNLRSLRNSWNARVSMYTSSSLMQWSCLLTFLAIESFILKKCIPFYCRVCTVSIKFIIMLLLCDV